MRRVEDVKEELWSRRVSSGTVSPHNQKIYRHVEAWCNREIVGDFPYLYLVGVILKRSWAGEVCDVSILVAIGVGTDGLRHILGVTEGDKENPESWRGFLRDLKDRGIKGVRLIISGPCRGLVKVVAELFPSTEGQLSICHWYRDVVDEVPNGKTAEITRLLKAIHAQEDRASAEAKTKEIVAQLQAMKLRSAAEFVEQKVEETLTYYAYPSTQWRQIRTNSPLERVLGEIRGRTRVFGALPDGQSVVMLVAARLRHIASTKWGKRRS